MRKFTSGRTNPVVILLLFFVAIIGIFLILSYQQRPSEGADLQNRVINYTVQSEEISYYPHANGYSAKPQENGSYPGIIMIHEWWGLNENIQRMARDLASQGYNVLAVDLYNGQVAQDPEKAMQLSSSLNQSEALANMQAAVSYLKNEQNTSKIASLGWCFGGGQSLQLSLNADLDATVIYYGSLVTNQTQLSRITHPVLGIFGSNDTVIPLQTVKEFNSSLNELDIDHEIYIYTGLGHAFANPRGDNYAPNETRDAWDKTITFLNNQLK